MFGVWFQMTGNIRPSSHVPLSLDSFRKRSEGTMVIVAVPSSYINNGDNWKEWDKINE